MELLDGEGTRTKMGSHFLSSGDVGLGRLDPQMATGEKAFDSRVVGRVEERQRSKASRQLRNLGVQNTMVVPRT